MPIVKSPHKWRKLDGQLHIQERARLVRRLQHRCPRTL